MDAPETIPETPPAAATPTLTTTVDDTTTAAVLLNMASEAALTADPLTVVSTEAMADSTAAMADSTAAPAAPEVPGDTAVPEDTAATVVTTVATVALVDLVDTADLAAMAVPVGNSTNFIRPLESSIERRLGNAPWVAS